MGILGSGKLAIVCGKGEISTVADNFAVRGQSVDWVDREKRHLLQYSSYGLPVPSSPLQAM